MTEERKTFDQWAVLELLGHLRLAGRVTEEEHFGVKMGRIDVPSADGSFTTRYFGGGSVYCLTPTTEEVARSVALRNQTVPIHPWEVPQRLPAPGADPLTDALTDPALDDSDEGY